MNTSNYIISGKDPKAVSIAGRAPDYYTGRQYKKLAPKLWFFKKYKKDGDSEFYTAHYYREVLDLLNPEKVYAELGTEAIILCWEKPGEFCHRRLVAEWLEKSLSITIPELEMPHPLGLKCPKGNCGSSRITSYASLFSDIAKISDLGCQCNKCGHTWNQKTPIIGRVDAEEENSP